jgi:phage shock protein A
MAIMKRVSEVFQAKANKVLNRVEDPRDTLDLSYEKQLEQLQQVRRGLADIATARKRIELQATQLKASADKLQGQAAAAMSQNNEELAREALTRRSAIASQLDGMKGQHDQLVDQEAHLVTTSQQLQSRVDSFRTQKEVMKASYSAAEASTKIGEAVTGISKSMGDTGLAMQRAQDKIADMQARGSAMDELLASGELTDLSGNSDSIQAKLDAATQTSSVDAELAKLKSQVASTSSPAASITSGEVPEEAETIAEAETVDAGPSDPFTLDK